MKSPFNKNRAATSIKPGAHKPPKSPITTQNVNEVTAPVAARPTAFTTPLTFTEITGTVPTRLTKIIGLNRDGTLRKETAANLSQGTTRRVEVNGLEELRDRLDSLTSVNAVTLGITRDAQTTLCTQFDTAAQAQGAIARTRENFEYRRGPGLFMIDFDGLPNGSLTLDQFRDRLLAAAPALTSAPMLARPSASAGCRLSDGRELTPLDRHRAYIPVLDASLIPEAGKALNDLLWGTPGDGWVHVGVAGQALMRCLLIRPCEVLSGITYAAVLKVANNPLWVLLQHCHVLAGRST